MINTTAIESILKVNQCIIYVLLLEDNCYYVGQTTTINRIKHHFKGKGSSWTQLHLPINIIKVVPIKIYDYSSVEILENKVTLEYMDKYGFENVRGGFWCDVDYIRHLKNLRHHINSLIQLNVQFIKDRRDIFYKYNQITKGVKLKNITVYISASCNAQTREGFYNASMKYKSTVKYLTKNLTDTTVNRCIISGIIDVVELLKEPCNVTIFTSTSLGIDKFLKSKKSVNADLLNSLFSNALDKDSILNFEVKENEGLMIRNLSKK